MSALSPIFFSLSGSPWELTRRESTPGFKRQVVVLNAETRSSKRASMVMEQTLGFPLSPNKINRISQEVGEDLATAEENGWGDVLTGEVPVPGLAIMEYDGGRIRTRRMNCGPGVHLLGKGWNETKNAILVSADSATSTVDPQPDPPACFLNPKHVAKLTETAQAQENAEKTGDLPSPSTPSKSARKSGRKLRKPRPPHQPKRVLRTVLSRLKSSREFGAQMEREARRRRFFEAPRQAFVGDGLPCNWAIHEAHFRDFTPILDFTHAVSYLFRASRLGDSQKEEAWTTYTRWMTDVWRGQVGDVIDELRAQQERLGQPPEDAAEEDPREQLRLILGYLENNRKRMRYDAYRCQGLPTTSAWMESPVKEINYRVKGTEMFWNHPTGAEAILQIRAAALSDDNRLARFLAHRPGCATLRRHQPSLPQGNRGFNSPPCVIGVVARGACYFKFLRGDDAASAATNDGSKELAFVA